MIHLFLAFPEHQFLKLCGFDGEGSSQILGCMELRPVPFVAEGEDLLD